jgi:hypothetical protein
MLKQLLLLLIVIFVSFIKCEAFAIVKNHDNKIFPKTTKSFDLTPRNQKTKILLTDKKDETNKDGKSVSFLNTLFKKYSDSLETSPYPTKMISAGIVGLLGDVLIQQINRRLHGTPFNLRRLLVFMTCTTFYIAPVVHLWFEWLNSLPWINSYKTKLGRATAMIILDQTLGLVSVNFGFYYFYEFANKLFPPYDNVFKRNVLVLGTEAIKTKLIPTMITNMYYWPCKFHGLTITVHIYHCSDKCCILPNHH